MRRKLLLPVLINLFFITLLFPETLEGFLYLGNEGETHYLSEKSTVAYGANGTFIYKYNVIGKIPITNSFFNNDPVPNVRKAAYYKPNNSTVSIEEIEKQTGLVQKKYPGFIYLGKTGSTVYIPENSIIAYGKDSNYRLYSNVQGSFRLTNHLLWKGSEKTFFCFYKKVGTPEQTFPQNENIHNAAGPEGYNYLAVEGETVYLPENCLLAYGANGTFVFKTGGAGYVGINNSLFGDPLPGVRKFCFYKKIPPEKIEDFENDPRFSRKNVFLELDRALESGRYETFYEISTGWINGETAGKNSITALNRLLKDSRFGRILAVRQFLHQNGLENIDSFLNNREDRKRFLRWILTTEKVLELYLLGGRPLVMEGEKNNPANSLRIWYDIYKQDPGSSSGIYLKLAIATALAFNSPLWSYYNTYEHRERIGYIDPVKRYFLYKNAHAGGELFKEFETLSVWEYRLVVSAWATDEDIEWARKMVRTMRPDLLNATMVHDAAGLMQYSGDLSPVENYRDLLEIGGMCGAISFLGALANQAFGIPALGLGQPGHASFGYRPARDQWNIGNNIYTWRYSYAEHMQGVETLERRSNPFTYFLLLAEARSNPGIFKKTEQYRWLADSLYSLEQRQQIRTAGISLNPLNYMLWNEKIREYKKSGKVESGLWNALFREYTKAFENFPDQLADFFETINDPVIMGRMDGALFTDYGNGVYAAMEELSNSRYMDKFSKIMKVVLNKIELDFDYLLPGQLSAADTSHQPGETADKLIDGKISSGGIWHTPHDKSRPLPQAVTITFDDTYLVDRVTYFPRQDSGSNGNILRYELYGSRDGQNYFKISSGEWENNNKTKTVEFSAQNLSDVRLVALEGSGGWASGDEVRIYKKQDQKSNKKPFYVETNYFDKTVERKTDFLKGNPDWTRRDPNGSLVQSVEMAVNSQNAALITGYSGEKQANIYKSGNLEFQVDVPRSGDYYLTVLYAAPYKNGKMTVFAPIGTRHDHVLTNSGGLWAQTKGFRVPLTTGSNKITLEFENIPLVAVSRIIITR